MSGIPGQGRRFDVEFALDQAAIQFWLHGYEGTSIATLTKAMKITPPSLYAAFGDKEKLFYASIDRYRRGVGDFIDRAFEEESRAMSLIARLLREAAVYYSDDATPLGCLIIHSATCVGPANESVAKYARDLRNANIEHLADRVRDDVRAQHLPSHVAPAALAGFVGTIIQGMAQRGRDGARTSELKDTAESTLNAVRAMTGSELAAPPE